MSATDIISRNAKKKKGKSQESVSGADRIIRRSIENNAKKIIYNELQTLGKMQNESISSAKRRYKYDENGNRIISYLPDTASYYEGVQNRRNEYQKKSDYVNYIIKEYGSKLNEDDLNNISNFLSSGNSYFNSLTDFAREDNEYFSQWADEDAYNRDYDNYTYSNKYKGKTYADLMKAKTDVEKKLSINKDDDTLNRELYWLENHKTDKQFADTMTTEELKQYKADNEERVKELKAKISKLKLEKFSYEIGGQTGEGNQRYKSISNEIKSAENELKGLKGKNSSVLYYDDEGIAVTTDSLLNIRENEGILSKINNDENVKSAYEKALDSSEKIKSLDKRATEIRNEITKYERAGVVPDGLNAELTSILNTINKHKEAIEGFNSLGYDFESLEHYKRWDEDRKNYAENQAKNEQYAKEHPFLATGKAILSAPVTALELAGNLSDSLQYGYANIYDDKYTMRNETYQSTVSNLINDAVYDSTNSELVSWLASSAYSGVTSAGQSALTAAACTVLFGGNIGGGVALAVMSTESASSAYRTAVMNGSTNQEALLTSVASGIGEALFEKIPLDNLLKLGKGTDINSMVDLLKGLAKQSAIEGLEEGGTEIWNTMADAIINGDHSAYNTSIDKYMKMGYSKMDATDLASKEWVNEFLTSFVGGMFGGLASGASAGVIPAVQMGINNAEQNKFYNQQGQNIVESGNVGELVDTARELSNGSKSLQKLANEVAGVNTENGLTEKQSTKYSKNVGKLYKAVRETQFEDTTNAERTTFKAMVKEELNGNNYIKNIDKVAEIITKKKFDSLSRAEQKTFDKVDGNTILEKVNNSEEFDSKVKQTATENAENFVKTGLLTINEKQAIAEGIGYDISDDGKTYIEATGEEISIKSIKAVGNDDVVVTLDSGDNISVSELMVSQDIAVISNGLKKLNANFNVDTDTANYIFNLWESKAHDLSAKDFMLGVTSAMEYGKINDENGLETDAFTKDLPAELRKEMFDMARNLEESNVQSKQNAIDEAKTIRRESGKGKARAEGTGTVKYDGINENSLDSKQKAQADLISTVMSVMGINVEFFASPVKNGTHIGESGSYNPNTNTIRIDIFAGNEGKGLMLYTASHELTHFIREWSPTKFKVFADFLMQNYKENNVPVKELIQAKINNAKLNERTLSYDAAYEEVVADACERFLADSNAKDMFVSLAQQNQSLAQKVLQWLKDFVDLIKNALDAINGYDADSKESAYVQEMTDALEGLRFLWDEALFDAMESYQWVGERVSTNEIAGIDYESFESAKNENGENLFQYRAIQHDVPEYRALLEKYGTLNATEIDNLFNTMEKAFAIIEKNLEILDYAWDENLNEDGTWDDSTDARAFKPVKPNSDKLYKYSLDFSTLCRKRLLQQVIAEELSMALDRAVTKAESIAIRDELIKLQEEGRQLEIACALCYVESARMKSPEQIQKFLNDAGQKVREFFGAKAKTDVVTAEENIRRKLAKKYAKEIKEGKMPSPTETITTKSGKKKWISLSSLPSNVAWEIRDAKREAKASYTPTAEENKLINIADNLPTSTFTTAEGLKNLAKEQPVIFDAYTSFIRNATHSKGTEKDVWYRVGDADVIGDDLIAAMNRENGLRSQSWSDFQVIHLLDYVGAIIELSTKNAKMQSYTKVADYVNLMGLTDMMINLSLIPTSEFNEKLDFDSIEGMAFRVALELRDKYPNTAGTISIGVADEQIKKLLESADIDYVIPYHQSGMKKAVRKVMHIPTWESYEAYQGEKKISSRKDAMANADKYGVKLLATGNANYHKAPNFSEWFDLDLAKKITELENIKPTDEKAYKKYGTVYGAYKAMQDAADTYIKLCAERGLMPKFSYGKVDFSKESNYWKLLIDRKMINQKTGEIIEQKAVKPVFNEKEILGILNNEIARYEGVKEDFDYATHYVVERFLNGDMDEHINDIAKHIGETVNNVTKVASIDENVKFQDRDSTGRELSPQQAEFFKDSKVRDADGNLIPVYHGTYENFTVFDINKTSYSNIYGQGHYFTSNKQDANQNYANINGADVKTKIDSLAYSYFEEMGYTENDLYDNDHVDEWNEAYDKAEAYYESGRVVEAYLNIKNPVYADRYESLYDKDGNFVSERTIEGLKARGFDGIIDYRVSEKFDFQHLDEDTAHYIVFDSNQIKLIDNLNPTENEDIRYQDRVTPEEDAEYLKLAKNPEKNEARLRELVDSVASKYGYTDRVYHGTTGFGFTKIDLHESDDGMSFFATDSVEVAGTYSSTDNAKRIAEVSNSVEVDNEKIIDDIYNMASNFADYCNRTLGVQDWVDLDYFKTKIQDCLDDYNNGSSMDDVAGEFYAFCDEVFYSFVDYYNDTYYTKKGLNKETIEKPTEVKKISDTFYDYVGNIIKEFQELKSKDRGIYDLFANTNGLFEIDGQGKRWNQIPFDQYDKNGFYPTVNTRQVARYAKSEGYKGAKISNIFDDGGKGTKRQGKPSTIYIFFNPQEQVKSADLVTYDDKGNIIPLSERFNEGNEDIRYSDRYTPIDLTKDNELSKLIGDKTGSKKYNAIRDYIWGLLGNRDIVFSDGTSAVIDRSDALHIANKAYDKKTAEISAIEKLIKSAVLFAEDYTEHKKFNYFKYYAVNVKHDNDEFPIYLNVGRGKNDKLFHLYDITKKIRDTANRINGFEGLHEFPSINSISVNSISNSPKNVNTKFQDRPYQVTLDDLGIDYKEENEKLKTDIDRLKDLVKFQKTLTHGTAFSTTSVNKQASMLMQEFGLHRGKEELAKMLNEYYSFIAKGEDLSWNIVIGKAEDIAKWIDSHIVRKVEIDGYSKSILSHIRSLRIKLDDVQKAEVAHRYGSYEAFRKSNIGNFILTDNGTELDSIWQELAELYPDTFDNDVNSADMPLLLAELLTDIRTTDNLLNKFNKTEELRWMAEEIYDSYWGVSTIHSLADKQQKEVNLLKSKHRQQMDELRENYANREKNAKDKFNEMLKKVKADKDAKFEAYKELKEEQKKNARERRNKTAIKNKFKTVVKELNSILNNGTKERNVKIDLQPTVSKALELAEYLFDDNISNEFVLTKANLTPRADEQPIYDKWINAYRTKQKHLATIESLTNKEGSATTIANLYDIIAKLDNRMKTYEKQLSSLITEARSSINNDGVTNSVNALADAYAELKNSSEEHVKGAYNDGVYDLIKTLAKELSGTKISDMNNIQMQHLYDAFKMVLYTVRTSNELFIDGKKMKVEEFSKAILREISAMKKSKTLPNEKLDKIKDKINSFNWDELKPYYAFSRIGSKTLMQLYEEARKAEDVLGRDYDEAIQFAEKIKAKYGYDSWDMDKVYTIKLASGRTIKLSLQELMSIYAYSKREQAYEHMKFGGFVFNDKKYFKRAKEIGIKQTVRELSAEAYTFDDSDLLTVKEVIKAQVGFVDEMQDFLSTVMGAKGNEISRQLYGVDWFKEKFYFPLKSSHDFLAVVNQVSENYSLRNSGMTKATVPHAQNPIVLEDFMSVWSNHVGKMSTYHALVLPIDNLNKALSYKGQTISVKSTLKSVFGKSVEDYLNNFIKDLNGGVTSQGATSPLAKMFSKFKKTAVSASTSVVVQQPTAILRAMAYINPKYFVGASDKLNHKDKWNLIKKYAPVAVLKEIGGFDIGGGKQLESIITSKSYKGIKKIGGVVTDSNYRDEVLMKPAGVADEIGWNIIWSAIEREVKSTTNLKIGTEEFYQECGKRFTDVVHKTQVYDSTFTRSGYQRSKHELVQMSMAFMGEPTTSYNMLFDAVTQTVRGNISKGSAVGIIGATLASIVMAAVAKSFVYALRDDDEDESYAEKYASSLTDNLISDLHIHNMLPFIKDFVSIFNGWDVERTDMAIFKDIKDALDGLDSTTKSTYRKMEDLLGAVASAFGVPLKNLMRTGREMYNAGRNLFDDNVASSKDIGKAVSSTIVGEDSMSKVNDLLAKGNTAKAKEMITEILNDKINEKVSEGLSREEAIKKSKSSIRSSLTREWKPLYLEAYANRDMAKMNEIRKILNSTGIYGSLSELDEALVNWKKSDD